MFHFNVSCLFYGLLFVYIAMFLCLYVSLFPSIQKTFIQKLHRLFASFNVSCRMILTCVTFPLVAFKKKNILGLFLSSDSFILFFANWLGGTSREAPLNESVKIVATRANPPKPRLHASLLPWTKTQF